MALANQNQQKLGNIKQEGKISTKDLIDIIVCNPHHID